MAFRRVIISGEKYKEVETDLKRFLDLSKTKIDFPALKVEVKQGAKPETLVVDINGDGADSFSKKVKDAAVKFQCQPIIKMEKTVKENIKRLVKEILQEEQAVSPLDMADGNINTKNMEKCVSLFKGLVTDLLTSGYFEESEEAIELIYKLIRQKLGSLIPPNQHPFQDNGNLGAIGLNEKKK